MTWRTIMRAAAVLSAAVIGFGTAQAEEQCGPLKLMSSIKMLPGKDKRSEYVPVQIAGADKILLVDTAAPASELQEAEVDALKLPRRRGNVKLFTMSGDSSDIYAVAPLKLGRIAFDSVYFLVAPRSHEDLEVAGILGADVMRQFDVEMDFGTDEMRLFSHDHCLGKVVYWRPSVVAMVPMTLTPSGHIIIPVQLDGQKVMATVDTGAMQSTFDLQKAKSNFGVEPKPEEVIGRLNDSDYYKIYRHTFKTLTFEGVTVNSPRFALLPDLVSKHVDPGPATGTHLAEKTPQTEADMILGMNILRHFRLYIAYKEARLYITPSEPAASKTEALPAATNTPAKPSDAP